MLKTLFIAAAFALAACAPDAYAAGEEIDLARSGLGVNPERSGLGTKAQVRGLDHRESAAVSVQVNDDGRVAIVTLYTRPCRAPSAIREGVDGWGDGHVVFDPQPGVEAGAEARPGDTSVRLCWQMARSGVVAVVMYRVVDGVESATDPILMPRSEFQIIPVGQL